MHIVLQVVADLAPQVCELHAVFHANLVHTARAKPVVWVEAVDGHVPEPLDFLVACATLDGIHLVADVHLPEFKRQR